MNITKQKQTDRYRKETSGYQWGEGWEERQDRGKGLRGTSTVYKINKIQRCNVQHRNYSQYFIITLKWNIINKNIKSLCCIPETNITL